MLRCYRWLAPLGFATTLTLLFSAPSLAGGDCDKWVDKCLDPNTFPNGTNGAVLAMTTWDPDGAGPLLPRLVIAGSFTSVQGVPANRVAMQEPLSGTWLDMPGLEWNLN